MIRLVSLLAIVLGIQARDVELYVEPYWCYLNTPVRIYGSAKPKGGLTYVRLELKKPVSGQTITKRIQLNSNGEYQFLFKDTDEQGRWRVKAQKEGTGQFAADTFRVSAGIFLTDMNDAVSDLDGKIEEGFTGLKNLITNYPEFPGKNKMERDLAEVIQKSRELAPTLEPGRRSRAEDGIGDGEIRR